MSHARWRRSWRRSSAGCASSSSTSENAALRFDLLAIEAVRWFRKAAEQENCNGQCDLYCAYSEGMGVAQDDAEAERWLRKSAALGSQ